MAVTVLIPTTLRAFTNQRSELELEGNTVGEIIRTLADEYPETKKALFDENGLLRQFINVFVNGENIKVLQGNDTPVKSGDEIMLIPAIAGGAPTESVLGDTKGEKLTNDEILRYSRHLLLKEVGIKGQKKLKAAKVLIVGMGGLGAPLAQYLAAAGVGQLGLIDFDEVDETNLQRQVIHGTRDIGRPKVASAKDSIKQINPLVKVETYNYMLTAENALDIIAEYDVAADASDNYQCRYLVNDGAFCLESPMFLEPCISLRVRLRCTMQRKVLATGVCTPRRRLPVLCRPVLREELWARFPALSAQYRQTRLSS